MEFKNVIVGNNIYGDDIKILEVDKDFDYSKLTQRFSKVNPKNKKDNQNGKHGNFDLRGISYELSLKQEQEPKNEDADQSQTYNTQAFQRKTKI